MIDKHSMALSLQQLSNGMQVILVPHAGASSVTVQVFVKVGSRYEPREVNGVSHFIEHLMFKGTKRRPTSMAVTKELDRYGAEFNAFTGKDLTSYYVKIDAAQTALAVDLLHDMLFHSKYAPGDIEKERGVIVEEINMYEDNPRMHIDDLLEESLFGDTPLGWNIAGPRKVIQTIPRKSILAYRDRYYVPSRMTIVVSGELPKTVIAMLEKTFGKVAEQAQGDDYSFEPLLEQKVSARLALKNKNTEQVQLGLAFYGLPHKHASLPAMAVLQTILGGSMSSRLFTEVREKRGLCYSIGCSHHAMEDVGMFSVMSGLEKNRVGEAIKVIAKELNKLKKTLVSKEELRHAKDYMHGKLALAFEDSATQTDWYGRQWLFDGKLTSPEEKLKKIERVKAEEVRELARQLFVKDKASLAIIGPFGADHGFQKDLDEALG